MPGKQAFPAPSESQGSNRPRTATGSACRPAGSGERAARTIVHVRKTGDGKVCQCESFAAVTERAALASGRWLGRGDIEGAQEAAISGMRAALDLIPIEGAS